MLYLRDTCLTLTSLVQAHPPAAALLLQGGGELVEALGAVHDRLLPAVHRTARGVAAAELQRLLPLLRAACHVELAAERLAQLLLLHCYVAPAAPTGGSSSGAGSSSAGGAGGSAVARGEALLHALMLLGHHEEEGGSGGPGGGLGGGSLSLGAALAERLGLGGSIQAALQTGTLSLDDAQADYVAALLSVPSLAEAPGPQLPGAAARAAAAAAKLAPAGSSQVAEQAVDLALLRSQIQQASVVESSMPAADLLAGCRGACMRACMHACDAVRSALVGCNARCSSRMGNHELFAFNTPPTCHPDPNTMQHSGQGPAP